MMLMSIIIDSRECIYGNGLTTLLKVAKFHKIIT